LVFIEINLIGNTSGSKQLLKLAKMVRTRNSDGQMNDITQFPQAFQIESASFGIDFTEIAIHKVLAIFT
jgi:hypothetical protein